VFLWYPTLESVAPESGVPSGLVFSSFMLSIAIGGKLFDLLQGFPVSTEAIAVATGSVATFSLAATTVSLARWLHMYGCLGADALCVCVCVYVCVASRASWNSRVCWLALFCLRCASEPSRRAALRCAGGTSPPKG
jgi:hypothetical protein